MYKIRLSKPYFNDKKFIIDRLNIALDTGYLIQGRYVEEFEQMVAKFLGVKHAIAVSSGTAALHLSLIAIGIKPGDEVIAPSYTFPATVNVIELVGAKPVLVDVDMDTYNIDVNQIEQKITDKTKAIIPVHLFGNPADMDAIMDIANTYNLMVIEDAAGALGSAYKGQKVGTLGDIGCFSFHPRKIITTAEGGMVVTNNDDLAEKVRMLRNHGIHHGAGNYDFVYAGFNYRMNELEAILGIAQMKNIESILKGRLYLSELYIALLEEIPQIKVQKTLIDSINSWQAFVVRITGIESSQGIISSLRNKQIEAGIGTYAIHILSYYKNKYGYVVNDYPNSWKLYASSVALPFYNRLKAELIEKVVENLKLAINEVMSK